LKINYRWLTDYLPLTVSPQALGQDLTMVGLALDGIEESPVPVLEFDITSNRSDCLCHLGVAREASALYSLPLRPPDCTIPPTTGDPIAWQVDIANPKLCRRYCALLISGVRIADSPAWLQERLRSVGQRPVNNVVDITNFVLLELGHPLHAFDLKKLAGNRIIVRSARQAESMHTLDGLERKLDPSALVIADESHPVALAGIMGGAESEISGATTDILLESAHFNPISIRRTARRLGLSTEASYRFERGADIANAELAIGRCARLILEMAGGRVASTLIDTYPGRQPLRRISLRSANIERLTGARVDPDFAASRLEALGFLVERKRRSLWQVTVPSFRGDIELEADLIEEVARHYGYDNIPTTLGAWNVAAQLPTWKTAETEIRNILRGWGYSEAVNTSFATAREIEQFSGYEGHPVDVSNPISEEETRLRWNILPMLLRNCRHNFNHGSRNLRVFELCKTYLRTPEGIIAEKKRLGIILTGFSTSPNWGSKSREISIFDQKGEICSLLEALRIPEVTCFQEEPPSHFNPHLSLRVYSRGVLLGHFGRLNGDIEEQYKFKQAVFAADLDLEALYCACQPEGQYHYLPRYPAVQRDISFVVDRAVQYNTVEAAVLCSGIQELRAVELFDLYRLEGAETGQISLSIRLIYQSDSRTLTVEEVSDFDRRVIGQLQHAVAARLRG
jgi:phenylalanyl-tRNA synthetase beta chain